MLYGLALLAGLLIGAAVAPRKPAQIYIVRDNGEIEVREAKKKIPIENPFVRDVYGNLDVACKDNCR